MAQSGYTPILIYASGTATNIPAAGDLISGSSGAELAINYADGKLYYKDGSGNVKLLSIGYGSSSVTPTNGGVQYGTGTALALTAAGSSGQILRSNGAAAPTWADLSTLGVNTISFGTTGLTPNSATAGAVTVAGTLVTANGGTGLGGATPFTANGVLYASSASALTSGSALTFDGTKLTIGTATAAGALTVVAPASTAYGAFDAPTAGFAFTDYKYNGTRYGLIGQAGALFSGASQTDFGILASSSLVMGASGSEQMRLTSTGLGIGTSSPGRKLDVAGNGRVTGGNGIFFEWNNGTDATYVSQEASAEFRINQSTASANSKITFLTQGTLQATLDSSGNLGLGVTPSAWWSGRKAFQLGNTVASIAAATSGNAFEFGFNRFLNSSVQETYVANGSAALYSIGAGTHTWFNAPSGTAGNAITFTQAMTLDSSGNLGIGTSSPGNKLTVKPSATSNGIFEVLTGSTNTDSIRLSGGGTVNTWLELRGYLGVKLYSDSTNTVTVDSSGNLGLGVTPSAWSAYKAVQVGYGALASTAATQNTLLSSNVYYDAGGTFRYIGSDYASYMQQYAGQFIWKTAPSGTAGNAITFTQAMTLDASGNLSVKTTTARANITTDVDLVTQNGLGILATSTTYGQGYQYIRLLNSAASYAGSISHTASTGIGLYSAGDLLLGANSTERARITSGGDLLVGTTSQPVSGITARLAVSQSAADYSAIFVSSQTTAANCYGARIQYTGAAPNGTSNAFLVMTDTGGDRAYFRSNGGLSNYQANDTNLSDRREKTNLAPAKSYLDIICAIPVQTFNYIDQNLEEDPGLTLGVVAQDVQAVAPELVMESNWGTEDNPKMRLSIYQTDLQYALMKCIQEQQALITSLTARVALLEGN